MTTAAPRAIAARRRGDKRRALGVALLAAGVISLALFVACGWKRLELRWSVGGTPHRVVVGGGMLGYYQMNGSEPAGVDLDSSPSAQWHLWYWWWDTRPKGWQPLRFQCGGPIWPLTVALVATGTWLAWWGTRLRRTDGVCAACGYDARGLSRCPECGGTSR